MLCLDIRDLLNYPLFHWLQDGTVALAIEVITSIYICKNNLMLSFLDKQADACL